ncbi:unannotated protein [freshwater metagenome]|uniref:Unannotated protein n=1 Tax=freshwater metagenome TaxID=449393 RepID=A0A6J6RDD3_9ZZZZ|nr:hypothetical protein [Actinomycetota bacterium]MSZ05764.1 hypothetical protein [Actinomycetota bacterium]MUH48942.1 hypothetical protein [Actinomycetota bacterium]
MIKRIILLLLVATLIAPTAEAASKSVPSRHAITPVKKKINLSPSPSPTWPPKGFKKNGEVYAKIPTAQELIGTASNSKVLTRQLAQLVDGVPICEKYSCGAVQLASLNGCTWWDITAKVVGQTSVDDKTIKVFGNIRTTIKETAARQVTTVLLISQEPLVLRHAVSGITANCHHDATTEKIPSTIYQPVTN